MIIVGSPVKVGSTWVYQILRDMCGLQTFTIPKNSEDVPLYGLPLDRLLSKYAPSRGSFIHKSHASPPDSAFISALPPTLDVKFVTVIRDPRDAFVSQIFHMSNSEAWGERFKGKGLSSEKEKILWLIENMDQTDLFPQWYLCPYALKLRYEDLLTRGEQEMGRVVEYLGLNYSSSITKMYLKKHSFERSSGRKRGEEDKKSFYRKGIIGDWKNYFDEDCVNAFKAAHGGKLQTLLVLLGYEKDDAWDNRL